MITTIQVQGMTCGHCVDTVQKAVEGLEGVSTVSVNLEEKQVQVDFDENRTGVDEIEDQIKVAGFEVAPG